MKPRRVFLILGAMAVLCACASSGGLVSSWRAPDAAPLHLRGAKVAAVVMMKDEASRRQAEDTLAHQITARGAEGIPMYSLLPAGAPENEDAARAAAEKAGLQGLVVMRPTSVDKQIEATPATYLEPTYNGYWRGYYGYGWGSAYAPVTEGADIRIDTTVSIETLVYSLRQNKLVWAGKSKTTNPKQVDTLINKLAAEVAEDLEKQGLLEP
jgi:hypothetical protein